MTKTAVSKYLRCASMIAAALAALLQAIAVLTSFESGTHYFAVGAPLPVLAVVLAVLGAVLGVASAVCAEKLPACTTPFAARVTVPSTAIGFLISAGFLFYYTVKDYPEGTLMNALRHPSAMLIIGLVGSLFLLIGAVYAVLTGIPSMRRHQNLVPLLGYFAILGTILLNAYFYFDVSLEMNAPFKLAVQMGLLCVTVYLTGEVRFLLDRGLPRAFSAYCMILLSIGSPSALSLPVALFFDKTDRTDYTAAAVLIFCTALTALLRLASIYKPDPPIAEEPVDSAPSQDAGGQDA